LNEPFLSIVIPAYNEKLRISQTLIAITSYLGTKPYSWDVIVANDGSTDNTAEIVEYAASNQPNVHLLNLEHGGKGWAVKNGMLASTGKYRFLVDADLSMPVEQIDKFLPYFDEGYDIVIGSREVPGARRFKEPSRRHIQGRVFNSLVRLLAINGISDTQCGFKCFTAVAAQKLFSRQRSKGFIFDVEVLLLAQMFGMLIKEIPIDWYYKDGSKVRPIIDSLLMLKDILLVKWHALYNRNDRNSTE
jgi:glycosyltransferase involved in cell wall biosynthesis